MSRWWAPAGAHIGPDEIDLERLQPGSDKKLDLGQYLLTVHRMGAAACEEAASGPIPDEFALIKRLADARAVFAPPVVEAVSKSLGDRPYADLLVRDVLDDAEQGALQVFRTAVSGGVPAPLAAQRAGMVYGVPPESLGPFLAVAKELRAHPAALADAADRCLFQAVEKAVLEEMEALEPEWEEVSKAPATLVRPDQTTTPYYDARDMLGRFAKPAEAQQRLSELLTQPVGMQQPVKQLREVRQQRKLRKPKTEAQIREQMASAKMKTAQMQGVKQMSARLQRAHQDAFKGNPPRTPTGGGRSEWPDSLMERVTNAPPYERLADAGELRVAMGSSDWGDMLSRFGEGQMFRIGHVVRRMGQGSVQPPGTAYDESLNEVASRFFSTPDDRGTYPAGPNVKVIPAAQMAQWEAAGRKDEELTKAAADLADEYLIGTRHMNPDDQAYHHHSEVETEEILFSEHFDAQGNRILVHTFPESRMAPIVELVVPREASYGVRASHGPDSGPGDIDLDPNQVYRVVAQQPDPRVEVKAGAAVRTYAIRPVDDDELEALGIEKADTMVRPDLATTPYYDARDIQGRFTAAPVAISEALKVKPELRQTRKLRQLRQTQPAKAATESMATARQGTARMTAPTQQAAKQKVAAMQAVSLKGAPTGGKKGPGFHPIDPGRSYSVMTQSDLAALVGGNEGPLSEAQVMAFLGAGADMARVTGTQRAYGRLIFGDDLHADLFDLDEETDEGAPEWEEIKSPYPVMMLNEIHGDADQVTYRVDEKAVAANAQALRALASTFFEENPNATKVELIKRGENEPVGVLRDIRDFTGHAPSPLVVVEIHDDLRPGQKGVLVPVAETRKNRLIPPTNATSWEEVDSPDFAFHEEGGPAVAAHPAVARNPKVRLYRLEAAK